MKKLIIFITVLSSFLSLHASFSSPEEMEMSSEDSVPIATYRALEFKFSQVSGSEKFYKDQAAQMQRSLASTGDILLGVQAEHKKLKHQHSVLLSDADSERVSFTERLSVLEEESKKSSTVILGIKEEAEQKLLAEVSAREKAELRAEALLKENQTLSSFKMQLEMQVSALKDQLGALQKEVEVMRLITQSLKKDDVVVKKSPPISSDHGMISPSLDPISSPTMLSSSSLLDDEDDPKASVGSSDGGLVTVADSDDDEEEGSDSDDGK